MFPWIHEHLLTIILASPLVGVLILAVIPRKYDDASSEVALVSTVLTFFLSVVMLALFSPQLRFAFSENYNWLPWLGGSFHVAVDGLSSLLVVITSLVMMFMIPINWKKIKAFRKEAFASILLFELGLIGLFCSANILLMYIFMEISVIFLGASILLFGGERRRFPPQFVGFMSVSSLLFLVVIVFLMLAVGSLDLATVENVTLTKGAQIWLLVCLLVGVAIRIGLFPFHGWFRDLAEESIDFVLLPAGLMFISSGYLLYRLLPPFAPAVGEYYTALTWVVASSIIITALISTVQKNFGSFITYVLRVHFGFIMLGIISMNPQGFAGSGMQMITAAISISLISALFVLLKRENIALVGENIKGAFANIPVLGICFLVVLFSLTGLPGLAHFPGLFMILMGLFKGSWALALVSLLGIVLITVQSVRFIGTALYREGEKAVRSRRVPVGEVFLAMLFVVIVLGIGIYPDIFLKHIKQSTEATWKLFSHLI